MKIFVTGADGFIGSHLVEKLIKLGHQVKSLSFYNSRGFNGWLDSLDKKILKDVEIVSGDIRDYNFLEKQMKNIDVVFHLAALIAIPYSYASPKSYIDTNINGTYNILQSSLRNNILKTIITSSSEVYGTAQKVPIDETHPLNAQSPYAATKIAADQLSLSYFKSYELPVGIIRPFNTFGPRQSARAVIPTIISQLIKNKNKIKIGNLSPTRDFTFVSDTVDAFSLCLKNNIAGEIINVGNKFEISIKDILNIFKKDFNYKFKIEIDKKRKRSKKSEVYRLWASNTKAKDILGWKPQYAGLNGFKKGLKDTVEWFKDKNNIQHYNSDIYNI